MSTLTWPLRMLAFLVWFAWQVVRSSGGVIVDVLTREDYSSPRVLEWESECRTDWELSLMAVAISLTPGTLVLALEGPERAKLYVHTMYGDESDVRASLATLERRVLSAARVRGVS